MAIFALLVSASPCFGQSGIANLAPVRTDSPRQTFESFLTLTRELESALLAYRENRARDVRDRITRIGDEFLSLIDLSSVPEASRRKQGVETAALLLDIFGRIELPPLDEVSTADRFDADASGIAKWRIPDTPIEIVRIKQGPREGEFLFSGRTVEQAPRLYREIRNLPLRSRLPIKSWSEAISQLTGPMIPAGLVAAMPDVLRRPWLDTPIWKILGAVALGIFTVLLIVAWDRIVRPHHPADTALGMLRGPLTPIVIMLAISAFESFVALELNIAGTFATIVASVTTLLKFLAAAWLFWLSALIVAELIIRSPKIPDQSLDASLLRLCARIVGVVGVVAILAYTGNALGLPVFSLIAGLGIGGLAVALAIRPTLENLVGGLILYADRPVRVGDFCRFNDHVGTIESIGVRSTQVRGLDRTLISVPNAKFADMEIINWAHCDKMLIETVIGLRYETPPDQLRYVLAKLREMLSAHPKIDNQNVRVSFVGYGASSLDINIRVYALTREWNEFHAIREDVFLRLAEIVIASGAGFAFPSQTLYVRGDEGLDEERSRLAVDQVESWRKSGTLPFPHMSQEQADALAGTLDYPPKGSPEFLSPHAPETASAERLSAEAEPAVPDDAERPPEPKRTPQSRKDGDGRVR